MPAKDAVIKTRIDRRALSERGRLRHGMLGETGFLAEHLREVEASDWTNRSARSQAALRALVLLPTDVPLLQAFQHFDLDPANPFHWTQLLRHFAEAHFGTNDFRGRRKKWNEVNLAVLLENCRAIELQRPAIQLQDLFFELRRRKQLPREVKYPYFVTLLRKAKKLDEEARATIEELTKKHFLPRRR